MRNQGRYENPNTESVSPLVNLPCFFRHMESSAVEATGEYQFEHTSRRANSDRLLYYTSY